MSKVLFAPFNTNHVLIFNEIIKSLHSDYEVLCHDRISEAEEYHTENIVRTKKLRYKHVPRRIRRSPTDNLLLKLVNFFRMKKQIVRVLKETSPDLVVLAIDNDPIAQIAIHESKRQGIKTLLVPEGLIKPYDLLTRKTYLSDYFYKILRPLGIYLAYIKYGTGDCDRILVSGKRALDILEKIGVPEDRMTIVGQQKYDTFLAKIKKDYLQTKETGAYLYAASTRIFENEEEVQLVRKLTQSAKELGIHLIVKLHPRAPQEPEELYLLIGSDTRPFVEIMKEGYDTFEILKKVDVVITISSAIVWEGLMMNKECILASYLAGTRRLDYDSYDAIHTIEYEEEIHEVMKKSMLSKKRYENKKRLLEDEIYKLDGKAGYRTARFIESMIS